MWMPGSGRLDQAAQLMQKAAAGLASSLGFEMVDPQRSHRPYVPVSSLTIAARISSM